MIRPSIFGRDRGDYFSNDDRNFRGFNPNGSFGEEPVRVADDFTRGGGGRPNKSVDDVSPASIIRDDIPPIDIKPPKRILGCTDPTATNYNARATNNNGTCKYARPIEEPIIKVVPGCTDKKATNYNPKATFNNGSCKYRTVDPPSTYNNINRTVKVLVSANRGGGRDGASIFVNGEDTGKKCVSYIDFTEKELLS